MPAPAMWAHTVDQHAQHVRAAGRSVREIAADAAHYHAPARELAGDLAAGLDRLALLIDPPAGTDTEELPQVPPDTATVLGNAMGAWITSLPLHSTERRTLDDLPAFIAQWLDQAGYAPLRRRPR